MKHLLLYFALVLTVLTACEVKKPETDKKPVTDTIPVLVTQIRKCAKLYTAEYRIHKIITHDDDVRLKGTFMKNEFDVPLPMSTRKIAIPMDAKLKAYIDFSEFSEKNVIRHDEKIDIILPDPKVELTSTRINHKNIKKQVSLVRQDFTDKELTEYESKGRQSIINSIPKMGIIDMARESAAHALIPMIKQMGFKEGDIRVIFRKDFTERDLPEIVGSTDNGNTKMVLQ